MLRSIVAASPSTLLGLAQHHYGDFTERDRQPGSHEDASTLACSGARRASRSVSIRQFPGKSDFRDRVGHAIASIRIRSI